MAVRFAVFVGTFIEQSEKKNDGNKRQLHQIAGTFRKALFRLTHFIIFALHGWGHGEHFIVSAQLLTGLNTP